MVDPDELEPPVVDVVVPVPPSVCAAEVPVPVALEVAADPPGSAPELVLDPPSPEAPDVAPCDVVVTDGPQATMRSVATAAVTRLRSAARERSLGKAVSMVLLPGRCVPGPEIGATGVTVGAGASFGGVAE